MGYVIGFATAIVFGIVWLVKTIIDKEYSYIARVSAKTLLRLGVRLTPERWRQVRREEWTAELEHEQRTLGYYPITYGLGLVVAGCRERVHEALTRRARRSGTAELNWFGKAMWWIVSVYCWMAVAVMGLGGILALRTVGSSPGSSFLMLAFYSVVGLIVVAFRRSAIRSLVRTFAKRRA